MVDNFFFPHTCEIKRTTGEFDPDYNEVFIPIYIGECGYQPSNNSYNASGVAVLNSPNIILPVNSIEFRVNDIVEVVVEKGRLLTATVEGFEDVKDDDCGGTTLWLKMGDI